MNLCTQMTNLMLYYNTLVENDDEMEGIKISNLPISFFNTIFNSNSDD